MEGFENKNEITSNDEITPTSNPEEEFSEGLTSSLGSEIETNVSKTEPKNKKRGKWGWILVLVCLLIIGLSIFFGYRNGVKRRIQNERSMLMDQISVQLDWVYKDMDAGRYENAKTRLEYIIDKYPNFPGAADLLVQVMMKLDAPTPVPTPEMIAEVTIEPEITPTPDTRAAEDIFNQIAQNIANQDWDLAIQNIHALKETNYDYRTVDVDGFYFIALRNRGIQRIWAGELEQGMYDLAVAGQLGAIDSAAAGAKSWGEMYLTGASYWDVNWAGAVDIFSQLYAQMPYFSDSTGMTSAERYRIALYRLGDQFATNGDYCTASSYYKKSLEIGMNADIQVTATWLEESCANPPTTETPEPTLDPNATPQPTQEATEEPPLEP